MNEKYAPMKRAEIAEAAAWAATSSIVDMAKRLIVRLVAEIYRLRLVARLRRRRIEDIEERLDGGEPITVTRADVPAPEVGSCFVEGWDESFSEPRPKDFADDVAYEAWWMRRMAHTARAFVGAAFGIPFPVSSTTIGWRLEDLRRAFASEAREESPRKRFAAASVRAGLASAGDLAIDAVVHVLDRAQTDADLGYLIGPGTETFAKRRAAEAALTGEPVDEVKKRRGTSEARQPRRYLSRSEWEQETERARKSDGKGA